MNDKHQLCEKITQLYPDIGACGIDIDVEFDAEKNAWAIDLKKEGHDLRHYLEPSDAEVCLTGKQCVSLGLDIAQLKKNIIGEQF